MTKRIWKYPLAINGIQGFMMPKGAVILTAQMQGGCPHIWAEIDDEAEVEYRKFQTFGTGFPMDDGERDYIGTYQMGGGNLVFHLYEVKPKRSTS